jgi:methyl-accepting chemotaxis protein
MPADELAWLARCSNTVKVLVDEMRLGNEEQARGIEQIGMAVTRMEKLTQTAAASSEESAATTVELNAQSDALRSLAQRHALILNGDRVRVGAEAEGRPLNPIR